MKYISDKRRLSTLRSTGLLDSPAEAIYDKLTKMTTELLNVPVALVSLVDGDRQFFKSAQGLPGPWSSKSETPLKHSFCKHVVEDRSPLVVKDASKS
ncbi:MAG: GAF domain-containing protein [Cryobacterium sp.]|nr:GAF domain-containing protein [Oligoflexia bacterium]